jgi:hypothetical protein
MGGEGAWDHINSCLDHASNWTCGHDHVLRALERICNDSGFATTHKRVLTSEGNRRADLEIRNIRMSQQTDLLVDVTVRHNFKGTGRNGQTKGHLRNPDNPDHILESADADKIRNYRDTYRRKPACGFLAGVHVYLGPHPRRALALDLLPIQQTDRRLFCGSWLSAAHRSFVTVAEAYISEASSIKTGAPSGWHVIRLWRCVAPPPPRVATSLPLAARSPSTLQPTI